MKQVDEIEQIIATLKSEEGYRTDFVFSLMKASHGFGRSIAGCGRYNLMAFNELAWKDPDRYFGVIETTQHDGITIEMLCGLLMPFRHKGITEDFVSLFAHLGARGALLVIRLLVDDYMDVRTTGTNKDLIWAIIDAKVEYRSMLLMGMLSYMIYSTRGALEEKSGNVVVDSIRDAKLRFLDESVDRYEADCGNLGYDNLVAFFNLNTVGDAEKIDWMRDTGLPGRLAGCYADALMLARRLDLKLTEDQIWSLSRGALLSNDQSHYWKTGDLPTLSLYLADALCSSEDTYGMWNRMTDAMRQTLYRESHQYYLGAPGRSKAAELYLCMVPSLIENIIADGCLSEAYTIWRGAWNDCVTALYSWTIPSVPFHIVQFLFVYKVVHLSAYAKEWDNDKVLSQLPVVWLQAGRIENVATACLRTLAKNLPDRAMLREKELALFEKVLEIEREDKLVK